MPSTVYIVHCIDTEGPLYESLDATFDRIRHIFHIDLEPSVELLKALQKGSVDLGGLEKAVQKIVAPHLLAYLDSWDKIDLMLRKVLSPSFRTELPDSKGGRWIYNWFCVDHVGYEVNPRRRDMGYHNIFDHYRSILKETSSLLDGVHFHYHPEPFVKQANLSATHWWSASNRLYGILSRRIIDRQWFPRVHRPGFHATRPDSHWFLEQFIPFDYASQAIEAKDEDALQFDIAHGRFGDWRRAPNTWEPYHPSHDDYQVTGSCRRWISRCLNVDTRIRNLTQSQVDQAFQESLQGKPVILAFTNHDFRDISKNIESVRQMIKSAGSKFPGVEFQFCEAAAAMRNAFSLSDHEVCELDLKLNQMGGHAHTLRVKSSIPIFGPQPYLAIKTLAGTYHHDNFDFQIPGREWTYVFDNDTFPLRAIDKIGVAANSRSGITTVAGIEADTGKQTHSVIR